MTKHVDEHTLRTRALVLARSALAQIETFARADNHLRTAFMHTTYRNQVGRSDHHASTRLTYGGMWEFATAHYLALVLLAQVDKVVELLSLDVPTYPGGAPVKLLRNLEEHWDEVDGPALRALRRIDPDATAGQVWFGGDQVMIGGATVDDLSTWLHEVVGALYDAAERAGQPLPSVDDEVEFTP